MGTEIKKLIKHGYVEKAAADDSDLALINKYTMREFTKEEIFIFKVCVCDNQIDRDLEAFDVPTLKQLAALFEGKTMIYDHRNTAANQLARIFKTNVEETGETSDTGEPLTRLIGHCYIPILEETKYLISMIESGIYKEVSVGCRIKNYLCSICKSNWREKSCGHRPGQVYDNKTCYINLNKALDAYEVSFVAVPAQAGAGVTKHFEDESDSSDDSNQDEDDIELRLSFINNLNKTFELGSDAE